MKPAELLATIRARRAAAAPAAKAPEAAPRRSRKARKETTPSLKVDALAAVLGVVIAAAERALHDPTVHFGRELERTAAHASDFGLTPPQAAALRAVLGHGERASSRASDYRIRHANDGLSREERMRPFPM